MLAATGGCSARKSEEGKGDDTAQQLLPVKYASGFKLSQGDGYICAELTNPWDTTRLLERYILVHKDSALPERLPQGSVVRVPLENTLVFSSVHCSLLQEIGKGDAIGGVCDSRYIYSDSLQNDCAKAGSSMQAAPSHPIWNVFLPCNPRRYSSLHTKTAATADCRKPVFPS